MHGNTRFCRILEEIYYLCICMYLHTYVHISVNKKNFEIFLIYEQEIFREINFIGGGSIAQIYDMLCFKEILP